MNDLNPLIAKANKLVESAYRLTLAEQKLVLSLLAQIDSHPDRAPVTEKTRMEVTASGISDLFDTPKRQAYDLLREAAEKLAERWVVIDSPDPDEPSLAQTKTRWVHAIDYLPAQGRLRLYLAPKVIPYLTQLAGDFTRYRLRHVIAMTSVYAIRLYELLVQWQSEGEREVAVEWIKRQFELDDEYQRIYDLKKRVIQPAVDQINEHSNLWVTCSQRKIGRRVVAFQFQFGTKSQGPVPLRDAARNSPLTAIKLTRSGIQRLALPGESWDEAQCR
jgi:plasmid replication initiation protein